MNPREKAKLLQEVEDGAALGSWVNLKATALLNAAGVEFQEIAAAACIGSAKLRAATLHAFLSMRQQDMTNLDVGVGLALAEFYPLGFGSDLHLPNAHHPDRPEANNPQKAFEKLCDAINASFPAGDLSDEALLGHPFAPEMLRYLVSSLRAYSGDASKSMERAFRLKRASRGKPRGVTSQGWEWEALARPLYDAYRQRGWTFDDAVKKVADEVVEKLAEEDGAAAGGVEDSTIARRRKEVRAHLFRVLAS